MQKRGLIFILASLFFINLVSAQFGYGYGSFSLADILDSMDPATITYGLLFFIMFTLIHLALSRLQLFKTTRRTPWGMPETSPNVLASGVISFSVAALIVYYLYRNDYNLESLLYGLGFSGGLLSIFFVIAAAIFAIFIVKKFKLVGFFVLSGLFLIGIAIFTELIYEKWTAFLIGLFLVVIGFLIRKFDTKKREFPWRPI